MSMSTACLVPSRFLRGSFGVSGAVAAFFALRRVGGRGLGAPANVGYLCALVRVGVDGEQPFAGDLEDVVDGGTVVDDALDEALADQGIDHLGGAAAPDGLGQGQDRAVVARGGGGKHDQLRIGELGHGCLLGFRQRDCCYHPKPRRRCRSGPGGATST